MHAPLGPSAHICGCLYLSVTIPRRPSPPYSLCSNGKAPDELHTRGPSLPLPPPSAWEKNVILPGTPPPRPQSCCPWAQDAGSTKMQPESRLVSGPVDHRYLSVATLRHRETPVDRPPTCRAMVRSGTSQTTAEQAPLDPRIADGSPPPSQNRLPIISGDQWSVPID